MAEADTIYRVLTVYNADTSSAKAEVGGFAIVLDHVMHLAGMVKDGIADMVGEIIHLGSEAEKAKISIAGLFNATGLAHGNNFHTALAMSSEMLVKMRRDAAALPGTFEDLTEIFQRVIPGGSQAGRSANDIEAMASKMMAVGVSFGMPAQFIGREMAEMMEGRVSSRVTLFAKLRQFMGPDMNAAKFNALGAPEKWEAINKALEKFNPMIQEYSSTWDAIESTSQSYLNNVIRVGSAGIFEYLKTSLADINAWYERNEEQILAVSRTLFDDLGGALKFVVEMVRGSFETISEWLKIFGLANNDGEAVLFLVHALEIFGGVMGTIIGLTITWKIVQWALNIAMLANPIGLVVLAVGALAAGIIVLIAKMQEFMDLWDVFRTDKGIQHAAKYIPGGAAILGIEGASDEQLDKMHSMAEGTYAGHMEALRRRQGDTGTLEQIKDLFGMSKVAEAVGNLNNPKTFMSMLPGMGVMANAGAPDVAGLLGKAGKPVTQHVTNIGAINMYNNIYDAQDPARVLMRLTNKAIRQNLERPNQSSSAFVGR